MIIIIPIGGSGNRFKQNGYSKPKALINIFGRPIIFWLLDNITTSDTLICIPYNREYTVYRFEDQLKKEYPYMKFEFIELTHNTRGASETILIGLDHLHSKYEDQPMYENWKGIE